MKAFWQGFMSIFDFGTSLKPSRRVQKILKDMDDRQSWYHNGPWWEHPIYGDTWKRKPDEK